MNPQTEQIQEEYDAKKKFVTRDNATTVAEVEAHQRTKGMAQDCCAARESAQVRLANLARLHHSLADKSIGCTNRNREKAIQLTELLNSLPAKLNPLAEDGLHHLISRAGPL